MGRLKKKNFLFNTQYTGSLSKVSQTERKSSINYFYDQYGRTIKESEIFYTNPTLTDSMTIVFESEFDELGRIIKRSYPKDFEVLYSYNIYGDLKHMQAHGANLWKCDEVNSLGQITKFTMGSLQSQITYNTYGEIMSQNLSGLKQLNYTFNDYGNMTSREDATNNLKEEFTYDAMNRLTSREYYKNSIHQTESDILIQYDDNGYGNMESKSDVGDFRYDGTAGPHALTDVVNIEGTVPVPQTIGYTYFNKVSSILDSVETDEYINLDIVYGIDNQRRQTIFSDSRNSQASKTKYFFGDYEEIHSEDTLISYFYVHSPSGICAVYEQKSITTPDSTSTYNTLWHVNTDHLGSPVFYRNAANASDTKEYSYSAWGVRRDPTDWSLNDNKALFSNRGFTFHEHLEEFALIDMNGRVYDPIMARFLSPDPYVQMPGARSGFNRYSYCLNKCIS